MLKSLLVITGLLIFAAPVEAHRRHGHYYQPGVWFVWQTGHQHHPRQPRIRINEHCVWKPWKNKTVCRY